MQTLIARRRLALKDLPPFEEILRGSVFVRTLRCGKPSCRCTSGDGHRAAYLSVTLAGGRTEQVSLPASLVPLAKRWSANYAKWCRAVEKVSAVNRDLLRLRRDSESGRAKPARSGRKRRRRSSR